MDDWRAAVIGAGVFLFLSALFGRRGPDYSDRLRRLERKVDALLKHHGLEEPAPPEVTNAVWRHLSDGNRIQAIEEYRRAHPEVSLSEAKDRVDELAVQHPPRWA